MIQIQIHNNVRITEITQQVTSSCAAGIRCQVRVAILFLATTSEAHKAAFQCLPGWKSRVYFHLVLWLKMRVRPLYAFMER